MFIVVNRICIVFSPQTTLQNIIMISLEIAAGVATYSFGLLLLRPTILFKLKDIITKVRSR